MKKLVALVLSLLLIMTFVGCQQAETESPLLSVLKNEKTFIDKNGKEVLLKDYKISSEIKTIIKEYTFVDMNADGADEVVIYLSPDYGYFLLLYQAEEKIFGYEFSYRQLMDLREDGSFYGSGGAGTGIYSRLQFVNNSYSFVEEMFHDDLSGIYRKNGQKCTKEDYDNYVKTREKSKKVTWQPYTFATQEQVEGSSNKVTIDLNKYIIINVEGYNGAGSASVSLDKEQFYLDWINKIHFKNSDVAEVYQKLYTTDSAIDGLWNTIQRISLDKSSGLYNGDKIFTKWSFDKEKVDTYFDVTLLYGTTQIVVSGLKPTRTVDPFADISVEFSGENGRGTAKLDTSRSECERWGRYELSKTYSLENGETIEIIYNCYYSNSALSSDGVIISSNKKEITVSGLEEKPLD